VTALRVEWRPEGDDEQLPPPPDDAPYDVALGAEPPRASRFRFLDDVEIEHLPPVTWLVPDHITKGGLCILFAPPESLKTFLVLSLAFSVASGREFFGRKVQQRGPVVYVAAEGSSGLPARVVALKHEKEWFGRAGIYFLTEPVQLLDAVSLLAFCAELEAMTEKPALVVFDTLHRCLAGGDENSSQDIGRAIQAFDRIRHSTGAAVLAIHHTSMSGERERGSTSLRGAADSMISLKREQDRVTVTCEKQKDAPHFEPYSLTLVRVQDSCVLVTAQNSEAVSYLIPGDPNHRALSILHASSMADGLSTTAWLKVSEMADRSFYKARKYLVANGYVSAAPKKGAPNIVTASGIYAVTANCNVTAHDTARQ